MKYYKYSFKCKNCGLVVYSPKLSGDYLDECLDCKGKEFKRRYLADFFRPFKYLFIDTFEWVIDKIKRFFWPAVLVLGVLCFALCFAGGVTYSVYSYKKNECKRVHNLGYETDFDFYGGCYVKVSGQWMQLKNLRVNVITEGK